MKLAMSKDGGYKGAGLELLSSQNLGVGDRVAIRTDDGEISGVIMPRYESASEKYLAIKLKSGYNTGVQIDKIKSISRLPSKDPNPAAPVAAVAENKNLPRIALISTGGTIASKIDYRTGGVHAALSASELYSSPQRIQRELKASALDGYCKQGSTESAKW
jgi:glutamyl-tRNA(Gln) amidotransferase subunit D